MLPRYLVTVTVSCSQTPLHPGVCGIFGLAQAVSTSCFTRINTFFLPSLPRHHFSFPPLVPLLLFSPFCLFSPSLSLISPRSFSPLSRFDLDLSPACSASLSRSPTLSPPLSPCHVPFTALLLCVRVFVCVFVCLIL